ncbi:FecR domain-containing protein [Algoriphagus sp. AGSA1]|uniref:FecR family protein n=1 Tax=Algoriphagus sp. AGSA1 TaxID=2907213 RepID=UPI001F3C31EB|nr:FecR domain-containing protein [Algoriphagus sp. AGSA1]MCE7057346.1 FecR domain-containing protein [Algoriphagus sp. AGSA1]
MLPDKEELNLLLEKYLQGKASQAEISLLFRWLNQLDLSEEIDNPFVAEEKIGQLMRERIFSQISENSTSVKEVKLFPNWLRPVAASILLLIGLVFIFHQFQNPSTVSSPILLSTEPNTIKEFFLPDSTRVILNASTTLELADNFNEESRQVKLIGEAFFDVKKDSKKPFIIHSGEVQTHVIGTAFNVEAYEGEHQYRVSLLRGKVEINDERAHFTELSPGQMLVYDISSHNGTVESITPEHIGAWMNQKIIFNNVPLQDAISRLRTHLDFAVEIDPKLSLKGQFVTGEYANGEAEQALEAILLLHNMNFEKKGGTIYISK